jgi:hypothetical protein
VRFKWVNFYRYSEVLVTILSLQDISANATPQLVSFFLFAFTLAVFTWHFCEPKVDPHPIDFQEDRAPAFADAGLYKFTPDDP